jgi:hypothetical protein
VKGISGFMNLTGFIIWLAFISITLIYIVLECEGEEAWRKVAENNKTQRYPQTLGRLLSIVYTLTLVFYGHILLAIVYLAASLVAYTMVKRTETFWEN